MIAIKKQVMVINSKSGFMIFVFLILLMNKFPLLL